MRPHFAHAWALLRQFLSDHGLAMFAVAAIAIGGWIASAWLARLVRRAVERSDRLGPTLAPVLSKATRTVVLAATLVALLDKFGVETSSLLAAFGAFGLGIGLALKDTLSDVAGGIELLVLRPFTVGDLVDIEGVEGTVEAIDVFEIKLTGIDGVPIMLANRRVRAGKIRNYTQAKARRIDLNVGVAYAADVDRAIEVLQAAMSQDPRTVEPRPIINVDQLADSSVSLILRVWIQPRDWFATRLDLLRQAKLALDRAGIAIPFPQRDVHIVERATAA